MYRTGFNTTNNMFQNLFARINNSGTRTSSSENEDYLKRYQLSYDDIESFEETYTYITRINKTLPEYLRIDCSSDILTFLNSFKQNVNQLPTDLKSWVSLLTKYTLNKRNAINAVCVICTNHAPTLDYGCACKNKNICIQCMLSTYYVQTEGLLKSFFKCPLCQTELNIKNITKFDN